MAMHQFPAKWRQTEKFGPLPIYTPLQQQMELRGGMSGKPLVVHAHEYCSAVLLKLGGEPKPKSALV